MTRVPTLGVVKASARRGVHVRCVEAGGAAHCVRVRRFSGVQIKSGCGDRGQTLAGLEMMVESCRREFSLMTVVHESSVPRPGARRTQAAVPRGVRHETRLPKFVRVARGYPLSPLLLRLLLLLELSHQVPQPGVADGVLGADCFLDSGSADPTGRA